MEISKEEIKKIIAEEAEKVKAILLSNVTNTKEKEQKMTVSGKLRVGFFSNSTAYYNIVKETAETLHLYGNIHLIGLTIHFMLSGEKGSIEKFEIFIKNL